MNDNELLLLGAVGIGLLLLYRYFAGSSEEGGGGGGGGSLQPEPYISFPSQPSTYPPGSNFTVPTLEPVGLPVSSRQSWTNVSFGQPGQPSIAFRENTLREALTKGATEQTKMAAAAIKAGAPPRIVAKIKAGKVF